MTFCIINGELRETKDAFIGITDLAIQRGYGIFDYFKILNRKPIFLEEHLNRFFNSAREMRLEVAYTREQLRAMIDQLIQKNTFSDSGIKLLLTGGYSTDGFNMGTPNLVITQGTLPSYGSLQNNGIRIITHKHQRQMPEIKTIDYLMAVWLQPVLKEANAQDVLYHDGQLITECPRSNIFIITRKQQVLTPARNVLKGIIRSQLLKLKKTYSIAEADISIDDLLAAKEVFITSTTKNVLPVIQIDDHSINNGETGHLTLKIAESLNELISSHPADHSSNPEPSTTTDASVLKGG